jgi:predicted kinase
MDLVILIGLPGAGKTSFFRSHFAATHDHVSKDAFAKAANRDRRQLHAILDALTHGRSVVVDNTNPARSDRAPLLALGQQHGATCIGYYFDVSTRQSVARNAERTGKARVPPVAIFTTAKRLQPPSYDEGFDQLWRVSLTADRQFHVTQMPRETLNFEPEPKPKAKSP